MPQKKASGNLKIIVYESHLYPVFLRLMERFEISYQIEADMPGEHPISSLVPLLLPHQPPLELPPWPQNPPQGQSQVEMVYRLDVVPAGIMSRFIVRTHRYTKSLHWRDGVALEYQGHQARAELNPMLWELRVIVQGPLPQNFFSILMHTIDEILARFEGLVVKREIPCICHWECQENTPCSRYFRYEDLVRRMLVEPPRDSVECPDSFVTVSVPQLLYGIHSSTNRQVISDIEQGGQRIKEIQQDQKSIKQEMWQGFQEIKLEMRQDFQMIGQVLVQQSEIIARGFTRQWNLEMHKLEAECPNTFVLVRGGDGFFDPRNWVSREYHMYLICQHPGGPHRVGEGYSVRKAEEWWKTVSPWLNHLVTFLKYGVPLGYAAGIAFNAAQFKPMEDTANLVKEIVDNLPEIAALDSPDMTANPTGSIDHQAVGPALRALYNFLKEVDPEQVWGGLHIDT